jgi:tetratricopeptide (TPR) repeat protein
MGFLSTLFRQDPSKYEERGDKFLDWSNWGAAKLEFEKALDALSKMQIRDDAMEIRLRAKLVQTKEGLTLHHMETGRNLLEEEYYEEAGELFQLAKELSQDEKMISAIDDLLTKSESLSMKDVETVISDPVVDSEISFEDHEEEYFIAICWTLPIEVRKAYISYGEPFRSGYLALNRGKFRIAVDLLSQAMEQNPDSGSYIPLELASAYINLGELGEARYLLETFIENHPTALPGYQLLCEVLWELKAFEDAESLLDKCPDELRDSAAYYLLYGETMFEAGKWRDTIPFYKGILSKYGWNEAIARALARSFEAVGELENALDVYRQVIDFSASCHKRADTVVKGKFADLSFRLGHHTSTVLEMYLSLAEDDPDNASQYFEKVSRIYMTQGNKEESHRFRLISEKLLGEKDF